MLRQKVGPDAGVFALFLVLGLAGSGCVTSPKPVAGAEPGPTIEGIDFATPERGAIVAACLRGANLTLLKAFSAESWVLTPGPVSYTHLTLPTTPYV